MGNLGGLIFSGLNWRSWLDDLFNLNFDLKFLFFGDYLVNGDWSIREEKFNGGVIIDAEHITGRKWISKYLKRFVLKASFFIIGWSNDSYKL